MIKKTTKARRKKVVAAYRRAAIRVLGITKEEAEHYIRLPEDDPGENAPDALAIVYLEQTGHDSGLIPTYLDYYGEGAGNGFELDKAANVDAHLEYQNAAVAAVWPD